MKKGLLIVLTVCMLAVTLSGCGFVKAVSAAKHQEKQQADVDLTTLSSTMVYSEVYNMMITPEDYVDKTVRMKGVYSSYEAPDTGHVYHACIIADATACCQQGIEFVPLDSYSYPDDFPQEYGDIEVYGTFEQYEEDGFNYIRLKDCEITVPQA